MVHHEGVGLVLVSLELILGTRGTAEGASTTIVTPIARVGRGRGRVMTPQLTIEWAIVGHLAMETHENGPP